MPQTGDGPFQRGERLTAAKLNDLADGRKLNAAGSARINRDTAGEIIQIDDAEIIYIKLTEKTGTSPIKYGWKETVRSTNTSNLTVWLDTDRIGKATDDYAIELNNSNLSTSDGYIYRAERSPHTGEWLFFLRKRRKTSGDITVIPQIIPTGSQCCYVLTLSGLKTWWTTGVDCYGLKDATVTMTDYNGVITILKQWIAPTDPFPSSFTFTPPYDPSPSQPLTIRFAVTTRQGTLAGAANPRCPEQTVCGQTLTQPEVFYEGDSTTSPTGNVFITSIPATITTAETVVTNAGNNTVTLSSVASVSGSINFPPKNIAAPKYYTFQFNAEFVDFTPAPGTAAADVLDFIKAPFTASLTVGPSGPLYRVNATGPGAVKQGGATAFVGNICNDSIKTDYPSCSPSYRFKFITDGCYGAVSLPFAGSTWSTASVSALEVYKSGADWPAELHGGPVPKEINTAFGRLRITDFKSTPGPSC